MPREVTTNRKLGTKGGIVNYAHIRNDLADLMRQEKSPTTFFTTMVDLYKLPNKFPGYLAAQQINLAQDRVLELERSWADDLNDSRFIPYIQLHEFETLLYCDLNKLEPWIEGAKNWLKKLTQDVSGQQPEEINEGPQTAPSKRITHYYPSYAGQKARVAPEIVKAIGLPTLREKCPHFNSWITKLENLNSPSL